MVTGTTTLVPGAPGWQPTIWRADALQKANLPEPLWIVPRLVPEGLSLVIGGKSLGKSWVAYDFGLAVSAGVAALSLDALQTERGEVLYMALEDTDRRVQDRIKEMLGNATWPRGLYITTEWAREDAGGLEHIECWLLDHPNARLIIIDILILFRGKRPPKCDLYAEDYAMGKRLKAIADKYHVGILLVHHSNRGNAEDWMDRVSGTTGVAGPADRVMYLDRKRGDNHAMLRYDGRIGTSGDLPMSWDDSTCRWTAHDYDPHTFTVTPADIQLATPVPTSARLSPERQAIQDTVSESSEPLAPAEIAHKLSKSPDLVRQLVFKMKTAKQVREHGVSGRYCWGSCLVCDNANNGDNGNGQQHSSQSQNSHVSVSHNNGNTDNVTVTGVTAFIHSEHTNGRAV